MRTRPAAAGCAAGRGTSTGWGGRWSTRTGGPRRTPRCGTRPGRKLHGMEADRPSRTAQLVAALRGLGVLLPAAGRLVDDPWGAAWTGMERWRRMGASAPRLGGLPARLVERGFVVGERAGVLWEGVTMYLSEPAIEETFAMLRELLCAGSVLAFTYFALGAFELPTWGQRLARRFVARAGEPW